MGGRFDGYKRKNFKDSLFEFETQRPFSCSERSAHHASCLWLHEKIDAAITTTGRTNQPTTIGPTGAPEPTRRFERRTRLSIRAVLSRWRCSFLSGFCEQITSADPRFRKCGREYGACSSRDPGGCNEPLQPKNAWTGGERFELQKRARNHPQWALRHQCV